MVWVKFFRLQEERTYTTRDRASALLRHAIHAGDRVRDLSGKDHRVLRRADHGDEPLRRYELDDGSVASEHELIPEMRDIGPRERLATLSLVHPEVVRARAQGLDLAAIGRRPGEAALLGARVQWLPHQIDVASRAVSAEPVRMLLADEVGLGKTVEAALIFAALRQEGRALRVLVLTPDALCIQWLGELFRKVHELFVLLDEDRLEDAATDFPDMNPFDVYHRVVTSIDLVAQNQTLRRLASEVDWDLVIIDEAHHVRWRHEDGGNLAYRTVEAIARRARHLLLLTATPMALDPTQYHALLRLLDPVRFDDPALFATTTYRVEVIREVARCLTKALDGDAPLGEAVVKSAREVLGDDPEDWRAFEALQALLPTDPSREAHGDDVLDRLRHRHGLAEFVVRNRRGPVGGLPERQPKVIPLKPSAKQAVLIDVGESVMLELAQAIEEPRLRNRTLGELLRALWATPKALTEVLKPLSPELVKELSPLIREVTDAPLDSRGLPTGDARLRWLVETTKKNKGKDKLLVFVESAVAVMALKEALEPVIGNVAVFHRGLAPRDQDRQVAWFRDEGGPNVMLSTEAGGEGRNFQFCHRVVLYDLPWRPATIEQRIGRVDRVGQKHDVEVLVPYFGSGYEAAILKIMQESIRVLDDTVGGIDPVLEYVSDELAELILKQAEVDDWKALFRRTEEVVTLARTRIESGADPVLDHASFSPERVEAFMARVPQDLEARTELFVERYADCAKLDLRPKGKHLVSVEGGPSAAGREVGSDSGYVATFSRTHALDHEDVEFLSFGHPLVEQALEWARTSVDASASVALCRGFDKDGAAFLWRFAADLPEDIPQAAGYLDQVSLTIALDEAGRRLPELETLLTDSRRPFDRMDIGALKGSGERWRRLVEQNHAQAEKLADDILSRSRHQALACVAEGYAARERDLLRSHARELTLLGEAHPKRTAALERHTQERGALAEEKSRIETAFELARPRLIAAVAVRMVRAKDVSA